MSEESKQVDPAQEAEAQEAAQTLADMAAGKQPSAESDSDSDSDSEGESTTAHAGSVAGGDGTSSSKGKNKKKKNKKRSKLKQLLSGSSAAEAESDAKKAIAGLTPQQIQEFMALNPALANELLSGSSSSNTMDAIEAFKRLKLQDIMTGLASSGKNRKDMASYKFWATQPVPQFGEEKAELFEEGPLKMQKVEDIPTEPAPLAIDKFRWVTMDLTDDAQMEEVEKLLYGHYVEDEEAMFRFKYSKEVLRWWVQHSASVVGAVAN
jgi:glycylpeptide N-tetradecanoyltransferase